MRIGPDGIRFIEDLEGFRPSPYQCQAGKWTIGFGHTEHVKSNDPSLTRDQATQVLIDDVREIESQLLLRISVQLTDNEWTVVVSLAFNMGVRGFLNSSIYPKMESGDKLGAAREIVRYCHYKDPRTGKMLVSSGLEARRKKEADLFVSDTMTKKGSITEC